MNKVINIALSKTDIHPLLEQAAMLEDAIDYLRKNRDADKAELEEKEMEESALEESIRQDGIREALYGVRRGDRWLICDGRHRRHYALRHGHTEAPLIEVPESQAREIILRQNAHRRRQSKGQIAWLAVCVTPEVVESRPGGDSDKSECLTRTALAAQVGVSADSIDQACKLYKLVAKSKKARAAVEAQIAAGCGLGGVIAGLAGSPKSENAPPPKRPASSLTGFTKTLGTFKTQFKELPQWTPEQQELAQGAWIEWLGADNGARAFFESVIKSL